MNEAGNLLAPPHSLDAEQSVLGALLLDAAAYDRISFLQPAHFYRQDHRWIFEAIAALIERGRPVDLVLLAEEMERLGTLEKIGGAAYLGALMQNTAGPMNIGKHAELVRDKYILRELVQNSMRIQEKAFAPGARPVEVAEEAETAFLSVLDAGKGGGLVHIGQAVTEYLEFVDQHPNGIETGLRDLDALTGGLLPGNLVIVAGRPHMGKTSAALQMAEHICEQQPGLMFSLESTRREMAGRMVEWHKHRAGRDAAVDKVYKLKLFIDDTSSITPGFIRSRLRRMKRQHGLSLIVVDYLQLVRGKGESREQEVASVSRELKAIAKEFNVPLIALAQLNREVEKRNDKRPHLSDLRESGSIEADADLILMLYRPDYYDQQFQGSLAEAEIIVGKNRNNGRTGLAKVTFSRDLGRFGDWLPERFRTGAA